MSYIGLINIHVNGINYPVNGFLPRATDGWAREPAVEAGGANCLGFRLHSPLLVSGPQYLGSVVDPSIIWGQLGTLGCRENWGWTDGYLAAHPRLPPYLVSLRAKPAKLE